MRTRTLVVAPILLLALAGCSSSASGTGSGSAASPAGGGSAGSASVAGGASSSAPTGDASTAAAAAGGAATFSGDFTGTIGVNLCSDTIASVKFTVTGDSTAYLGSISGTSAGFIGPGGGPFALDHTGPAPVASADGTSFDLTGVVLTDETLTHKKVTLAGTITCP